MVELMVGVAIGLIAMLVVFQTLATWDARRRATTAGSDAQVAGTVGLFSMERDLRIGGWGFGTNLNGAGGCYNVSVTGFANPATLHLVPVEIVPVIGEQSDTGIQVLYGNSALLADIQPYVNSAANSKKTLSNTGFATGDLVVSADSSGSCDLVKVTGLLSPDDGVSFAHSPGTPTASAGNLFDLGPAPIYKRWYVKAGGVLATQDLMNPGTVTEVTDGIVDMKAQYGVDGVNGGAIDNTISANEWTLTAPTDWTKLLAIRVAILARSQRFEKPDAVLGCQATPATQVPKWSGSTPPPPAVVMPGSTSDFIMKDLDGSNPSLNNDANDWRCYRYRVYEKIIPLRNAIWGNSS